jgi:hypothetical protein
MFSVNLPIDVVVQNDCVTETKVTDAYVCRLLPLTCLAPDIVEAILDGRQPNGLRLADAGEWAAGVGAAANELDFGLQLKCEQAQDLKVGYNRSPTTLLCHPETGGWRLAA